VPDGYAAWLDRDVVAVTGPDAASFLQGQLSQDVLALGGDTDIAWSWVLAPTGKVDALVRVTRLSPESWLLDTDGGGGGDRLLNRLRRFKLRTKVDFEVRPWKALFVRFPDGRPDLGPPGDAVEGQHAWPGPWLTGVVRLGADPAVPEGWALMSPEDYEAERIVAGVPRMGAELTDKTIPGETGLIAQTVSFTKGCYTGQELVARIDSRGGHVPRHLRAFVMPEAVPAATDLIDGEGRTVGTLTSVGHSSRRGWVGLGYVRRGSEVPGRLRAGSEGPEVEVRELQR
jgi:folate-binding protein YgfZ